jgi:hypothetical protein
MICHDDALVYGRHLTPAASDPRVLFAPHLPNRPGSVADKVGASGTTGYRFCPASSAELLEHHTSTDMSGEEIGLDCDGSVITPDRRIELLEFSEQLAALVVSVGIIGPKRDRSVITGERRIPLIELLEGECMVEVRGRTGRFDVERFADQLQGLWQIPGLAGEHARQMERVKMPGFDSKDFLVHRLRLRELSYPMKCERLLELVSHPAISPSPPDCDFILSQGLLYNAIARPNLNA